MTMKDAKQAGNKKTLVGERGTSMRHGNAHIGQARNVLKTSIVDASVRYKQRSAPEAGGGRRSSSIQNLVISGLFLCLFLGITSVLVFFCLF
jgi:hypothetical protein